MPLVARCSSLLGSVALVAFSACQQPAGQSSGPVSPPFSLSIQASASSIPADFFTTADLRVEVQANGALPPTRGVFITATKGRLIGTSTGSSGQSVLVDVAAGSASSSSAAAVVARVQCLKPKSDEVELETMHITAALIGGDGQELVHNSVDVACVEAPDRSGVQFLSPMDGDRIIGSDVQIELQVLDFHAGFPSDQGVVHVESLSGLGLRGSNSPSDTLLGLPAVDATFTYGDGLARVVVFSPGEWRLREAAYPFILSAQFTNHLGVTKTAVGHFTWDPTGLPSKAGVSFMDLYGATDEVIVRRDYRPQRAFIPAGQGNAWVGFLLTLTDWDGDYFRRSQEVTITCLPVVQDGAAGVENCKGLTGWAPQPGTRVQVVHAPEVVVETQHEIGIAWYPVVLVRFQPPATSVPGTVRLKASWVTPDGTVLTSPLAEMPMVSMVDDASLTVWPDPIHGRQYEFSPEEIALHLRAFAGTTPATHLLVCASLDAAGAALASLEEAADDVGLEAVVTQTDDDGRARVGVVPRSVSSQGDVTVRYTVVRVPYSAALDDNALTDQRQACSNLGGANVVSGSETFTLVAQ